MEPSSGGETAIRSAPDSVAVAGDRIDPVPFRSVLRLVDRPRFGWLSDAQQLVSGGATATLATTGPGRFAHVRRRAEGLFDAVSVPDGFPPVARPRLVGGFAFHDGHEQADTGTWRGYPGAKFVLPAVQVVRTAAGTWLTATATGSGATHTATDRLERWRHRLRALPTQERTSAPAVVGTTSTPDRAGWHDQVRLALDRIESGTLSKVVLAAARAVDLANPVDVPDMLDRLSESHPDCTRFLVDPTTGGTFFGATPEQLVSLRGRSVRTTVLAGSTGRGDTDAEDTWLAEDLRGSAKDSREHEVVVEAIEAQLGPLTSAVRTGNRDVRQLATVQHLETPVRATLDGDHHVLDLVEALHPTPAVGGMPQRAALRTIRTTEAFERGWYAAPVGWFDAEGDGSFSVGIRSAVADGDRVTLYAGNGIVADSDPDREWSELQLKYRSILDELE